MPIWVGLFDMQFDVYICYKLAYKDEIEHCLSYTIMRIHYAHIANNNYNHYTNNQKNAKNSTALTKTPKNLLLQPTGLPKG